MSTQEHILSEAGKLLSRIGPQSMTMDLVARTCGISKRTLYETFPDKRTLIKECIDDHHQRQNAEVRAIFESSPNCYDALFQVYRRVREYLRESSMNYIDEIRRLYPEIFAHQQEQEKQFVLGLSRVLVMWSRSSTPTSPHYCSCRPSAKFTAATVCRTSASTASMCLTVRLSTSCAA